MLTKKVGYLPKQFYIQDSFMSAIFAISTPLEVESEIFYFDTFSMFSKCLNNLFLRLLNVLS